ncbi:MAG: asparagine synthase C-terminal domain-containing protein [Methanomassiliicoccales archaeon]
MAKADDLLATLRPAVSELCPTGKVGVLFSGGIDSTIVAALAAETTQVQLYTVGVGEAHDLSVAEETAKRLGLPWTAIRITGEQVVDSVVPVSEIINKDGILPISFEMPAYFVCGEGTEQYYLSGQGADELFGGYTRYVSLSPEDLRSTMTRDIEALLGSGISMEHAIARHFRKVIGHPYLDPDVVRFAAKLTSSDCISGGARKIVLGQVASLLGLDFLASRQKKAAQYGSGIMKVLKAEAKERGVPVSRLVASLKVLGQSV